MARMDVSTQSAVILSPVMGRYVTFQGLMLAVKWLLKCKNMASRPIRHRLMKLEKKSR